MSVLFSGAVFDLLCLCSAGAFSVAGVDPCSCVLVLGHEFSAAGADPLMVCGALVCAVAGACSDLIAFVSCTLIACFFLVPCLIRLCVYL